MRTRTKHTPTLTLALVAVSALSHESCSRNQTAPIRPVSVPDTAIWAGGPDGGAWVSCRWTTKEPYLGYDCLIFHDPSGDAWAAGTFALVEGGGSDGLTTQLSGPFAGGKIVALSGYDGERIFLANGRVLVPHIEVSYSSGNGHGRKVRYEFGKDLQETPF